MQWPVQSNYHLKVEDVLKLQNNVRFGSRRKKRSDLLQKFWKRRLALQDQVISARQGNKARAGDARGQLPALIEGDTRVIARVHN